MRIDRLYMTAIINALRDPHDPKHPKPFQFDDGVFGSRFGVVEFSEEEGGKPCGWTGHTEADVRKWQAEYDAAEKEGANEHRLSRLNACKPEPDGMYQVGYFERGGAVPYVFGPVLAKRSGIENLIARIMEIRYPRQGEDLDAKGRQVERKPAPSVCVRDLVVIDRTQHTEVIQIDELALAEQAAREREAEEAIEEMAEGVA